MSFDLEKLARASGYSETRILREIAATQYHENELYKLVASIVRTAKGEARNSLAASYGLAREAGRRQIVEAALADLKQQLTTQVTIANSQLPQQMNAVGTWHNGRWAAAIQTGLGIDVRTLMESDLIRPALEAAVGRNSALITGLSDELHKKIAATTWESWANGDGKTALYRNLVDEMGFAPARARLIARDQTSSLIGDLDEVRHREAELDVYQWSTTLDGRERKTHRANNEKYFRWDEPPLTGHPGDEVNCRCKSRAVVNPEGITIG